MRIDERLGSVILGAVVFGIAGFAAVSFWYSVFGIKIGPDRIFEFAWISAILSGAIFGPMMASGVRKYGFTTGLLCTYFAGVAWALVVLALSGEDNVRQRDFPLQGLMSVILTSLFGGFFPLLVFNLPFAFLGGLFFSWISHARTKQA